MTSLVAGCGGAKAAVAWKGAVGDLSLRTDHLQRGGDKQDVLDQQFDLPAAGGVDAHAPA
jgi:hypothetical protein